MCNDPRNVGMTFGSDGVQPFKVDKGHGRKKPHAFDVLLGIWLNLPPWLRTKPGAIGLFGLTPGPRTAHLTSYILMIMHQVCHAYLVGIPIKDAAWQPGDRTAHGHPMTYEFLCRLALLSVIGDAPAIAHMFSMAMHGSKEEACALCA
jgi:hypothetical protein